MIVEVVNMKRIVILLLLVIFLLAASFGCKPALTEPEKEFYDVSNPTMRLAYKSDQTTFSLENVALSFYCGSENAGGSFRDFTSYPTVTYIFFANKEFYSQQNPTSGQELTFRFREGYHPEDLYSKIETDPIFSICKKSLSSDTGSFYKNNTVSRLFMDSQNATASLPVDRWGNGSALYKATPSDGVGILIPDVSYTFTIPQSFFPDEEGFLFFGGISFCTEHYENSYGQTCEPGDYLEHATLSLYYKKSNSTVILSSFYGN